MFLLKFIRMMKDLHNKKYFNPILSKNNQLLLVN